MLRRPQWFPWVLCIGTCMAFDTRAALADDVDYLKQVKPLLATRCGSCHGSLAQKAKLRLDTADLVRKGGRSGPAVVPGKSAESLLIRAVLGKDRDRMPPEKDGAALTKEQIALLSAWIDQGANGPPDEPVPEDPRKHWAFQKPVRPAVPKLSDTAWSANPIDAFIHEEFDRHNLRPNAVADKAVLLRRVTLDLTGLPPTREQLHAFLKDTSPDAYEKVVERLLASPDYGERWARHWMDVWRYSDWYGRRQEKDWRNSSPTMWRWRDWIVNSLNADLGYDRMLREMLAADEIAPEDDSAQAATGFLVRNYYSLNFDTWMKDQVEHTAKAFLGLTLNCCHCHDHKYDPISQEDYFRFRAFFEPIGLRQDRVKGEPDPGPFKKYDYASSGKVIDGGLVRVLDDRPDAKTRMHKLGNDRDYFADRAPVSPGAPACVGGDKLTIHTITLPSTASYPGLKSFIRDDEMARLTANLTATKAMLAKTPADALATARVAAAEAELRSLKARIAADDARFLKGPGNADVLARIAARAEREAAVAFAEVKLLEAEAAVTAAKAKNDAKALTAAEAQLAASKKSVEAARTAMSKADAVYTPLSPTYPTTSTGRRKALAEWIASRDNPLTARVAVNHIWARHFGKPLVESVFDLGLNGKRPSHPALFDWLAVELVESKWSMKHLHKLIVTSRAYRLSSSAESTDNKGRDPDNRWLWHFPSRRLEAEAVRDSLLFVAGDLDGARGGREIESPNQPASRRRSLYFSCHPEAGGSPRLLEFFDVPDPCDCYRRPESLVPQQSLALTNSDFVLQRSQALAGRLLAMPDVKGDDRLIVAAFETVLTRVPTEKELAACRDFLNAQIELVAQKTTPEAARRRAWESLARVLFNHHDFITIR